ncbi:alpha/beta hydrolase [Aequorivita antarctica]|uniref:Alpha/beta hydrolase n=1 Tax=Aequorivita antarctica TaxID=153266 RepID=A0A5C6YZ45_9FLAO|nr:alpha/beta hydrolase [Aequorivita antarctica]TXD72340.1 alpha/beta hydrolase [Aequorivita antarctica]SRX74481.1 Carboxylesterase NlhH [Aequorivita antarctica]
MKVKNIFFLAFILFLLFTPSMGISQEAWLSTPESINQFREQVESIRPDTTQFDLTVVNKTIQITGREIDIRIYKPKGTSLKPTLIYVHGACWVAGSLDSHDEICRYLAVQSDVNVIAINYRLAPENKYPDAHNDVYDATEWIWKNAKELGLDTEQFAIAGESTGAYFTAATTLKARDTKGGPKFSFQLLVYAALDGGGSSWSECKDLYFTNEEDIRSEYGSPLWSKNLSGLPTTFNILGEYETSRAEEELFMRKLKENGITTKSFMNEGVGHDVVNWLSVKTETPAHLKAIEFIKAGFNLE